MKIDMMRDDNWFWDNVRSRMWASIIGVTILAIVAVIAAVIHNMLPIVEPNEQVELYKGQSVRIKGTALTIGIKDFRNDSCPVNADCIRSGGGVEWTIMVNTSSETRIGSSTIGSELTGLDGYKVKVVDTDNSTFLKFIVMKDSSHTMNK